MNVRQVADLVAGVLVVAALCAVFVMSATKPSTDITRAYGVVSVCGVYAVIVVRADGTSELIDTEHPPGDGVEAAVVALPDESRPTIVVPCVPTLPGLGA